MIALRVEQLQCCHLIRLIICKTVVLQPINLNEDAFWHYVFQFWFLPSQRTAFFSQYRKHTVRVEKNPQKKQLYITANWCLRNTFCTLNMSESTETISYNEGFSVYFFTSFHSQMFKGPQTMIQRDNYFPIFEVINRQRMWSDTHTHTSLRPARVCFDHNSS